MKKLSFVVATLCFTVSSAFAQAPAASCEAKAVDKNGKALAGAAKNSFMKKCEADNKDPKVAACEAKAVGKNGKALAGAAKTSFMKKCQAEA
jgi:curli biogenesis system outer membrane secretion channel CsgG